MIRNNKWAKKKPNIVATSSLILKTIDVQSCSNSYIRASIATKVDNVANLFKFIGLINIGIRNMIALV